MWKMICAMLYNWILTCYVKLKLKLYQIVPNLYLSYTIYVQWFELSTKILDTKFKI